MKSAYILHGCCDEEEYFSDEYPSPSNFHWLPWLQKQFLKKGYFCQTPEMPQPYIGKYPEWKRVFDIFPVDKETSLIAHSCSCGFFLRWLSDTRQEIDKLVLVAPWLDPAHTRGDFLKFILDPQLAQRVNEMHIFYSEDEFVEGVKETVDLILKTYPIAKLHTFEEMGHFCLGDMGTTEFPELLKLFD